MSAKYVLFPVNEEYVVSAEVLRIMIELEEAHVELGK